MDDPLDYPPNLVQAVTEELFGGTDVEADLVLEAIPRVFDLAQRFAAKLAKIRRTAAAMTDSELAAGARSVLLMALRSWFHGRPEALGRRQKAELRQRLEKVLEEDPLAFRAAVRLVVEAAASGDAERASSIHVAGGATDSAEDETGSIQTAGGTAGSAEKGESAAMTSNPKDNAHIIAKALEEFAFDEAKLPKRLHYDSPDVPSVGQENFLSGVIEAIVKLEPGFRETLHPEWPVAAVSGLLLQDGHDDPNDRGFFDHVQAAWSELLEPASTVRSEIDPDNALFDKDFDQKLVVFSAARVILTDLPGKVFFDAFAAVSRAMVDVYDTRPPGSAGFHSVVLARYHDETLAAGGGGGGGSGIAFLDLPPLTDPDGASDEIVPENIRAISAIYVVHQCDQMMVFAVVDRIVELFMAGLLPMGGDTLARKLDDWYWDRDERISPSGRTAQFTRALGVPGGEVGADVMPNADFETLLMRSVSSFAEFERERSVGQLFDRSSRAMAVTGEYCRKAVRDLAANCTLYGYAGTQFAAERLGRQLQQGMAILQLPRIREIYGVSTMYQVIERVAQSEFGVTVNVVKHRTLAEEVRKILGVVADHHHVWSLSSDRPLFTTSGRGADPIKELEQGDLDREDSELLFRAAQYILAVSGVQGETVSQYSQPVETPALPSLPDMGAMGGGVPAGNGDIASQLKDMLDRGQTPTPSQIRSMIGF